MGISGAAVHLKGRGDFVNMFVLELAPGAASSPQRHLYEEVLYVLAGRGSTTIEGGRRPQAHLRMGTQETCSPFR